MIVKMKALLLFAPSNSVDETILRLGAMGMVDIREVSAPSDGESTRRQSEELNRVRKAIALLRQDVKPAGNDAGKPYQYRDPKRLTHRLLISLELDKACDERLASLEKQKEWYRFWGKQLDPKDLAFLREKGIQLHLYRVKQSQKDKLPPDAELVLLPVKEGLLPVVGISKVGHPPPLSEYPEDNLPGLTLSQIEHERGKKERQKQEIRHYWSDQLARLDALEDYRTLLEERLQAEQVLSGMGQVEGKVSYLRGYLPAERVAELEAEARQMGWGYWIKEPGQPDEVPVFIRNPRWVRIIDPVMEFIGIVPGYKELDVSPFFLFAFALFFAMLVGDAGYGALFLLLTLLLGRKIPSGVRLLFVVLSLSTIVWGVLSGTYFGSKTIAALPFFNQLVIPEIASFGVDNMSFMMHLSFLIGAIHLTIAHAAQAFRLINSRLALGQLGWIGLVWGLFFVVENLVLGKPMPPWNTWLFVAGGLLVALFSEANKSFLQGMLVSVANLPLSLINGFSDIVSYVRLFAVGLATAAVAASFNNMVLPDGAELSWLQLVGAALALTIGHGLNIVLALMAVMVHGIRLNMLEFAGHLGVQFSGEQYKPFRLSTLLRYNGSEHPVEGGATSISKTNREN